MSIGNVKWQPWLTLFQTPAPTAEGQSAVEEVVQAREEWLDTGEDDIVVVATEIAHLTYDVDGVKDVKLRLESCNDTGGVWNTLSSFTAATFVNTVFRKDVPDGTPNQLQRWLRWRIDNSHLLEWKLTFRLHATGKDTY
jgi:hypothetical protein